MAPANAPLPALTADARRRALRFVGLAVSVLLVSGLLSLCIVFARLPVVGAWIGDPLFFKRCLVVHVDLALVVWFYSFLAALFALIPTRAPTRALLPRLGFGLALLGVVLLVASAAIPGVAPVLANYVPMLDTPLYAAALVLFATGVGLTFLAPGMLPGAESEGAQTPLPPAARPGIRAAAVAFWLALATFAAAVITTPRGLPVDAYYELVAWGGGHTLQFASEAAMVACWLLLLERGLGRAVLSRATASLLFALLIAPTFAAPLLALSGTTTNLYHTGFTRLMQWGVFPVVVLFLGLCLRALWGAARAGALPDDDGARIGRRGFAVSAALTACGFVLGALIRGPNTMVPAHYHANIGAVTASFMAATWLVFDALALPIPSRRLARAASWQPVVFGVGQLVFAVGFGLAGSAGAARKTYGAEQHVRSLGEWLGLSVMGLGGLVAVGGGVLFIVIAIAALRARRTAATDGPRRHEWSAVHIPSRS